MIGTSIPNAEAIFYQYYEATRRDEVVGILLALFLGGFGAHRFYLRQTGRGVLYLLFCWTGIPSLIGLIECFLMPGRVREFNALQAATLAASLGLAAPPWNYPARVYAEVAALPITEAVCPRCDKINPPEAKFCSSCGAAL
jgi:TM2 domain-containing membrane protein YozV/ribosomal protein L40E